MENLANKEKNPLATFIPMAFMLGITLWAMAINLSKFIQQGDMLLLSLSVIIILLTAWLLIGATASLLALRKGKQSAARL